VQRRRIATILAAVAALVGGLALASCGGDDSESADATTTESVSVDITTETTKSETTTTEATTEPEPEGPTVVRVTVVDGAPKGGIVREKVSRGDRVALVVTSDVADEIHLHGYDIEAKLVPQAAVELRFSARAAGRFPLEIHGPGTERTVGYLEVHPR